MRPTVKSLHLNNPMRWLSNISFRTDFEGDGSASIVKLVWDWRFARVYDDNEMVVDECIWSGNQTPEALFERLSSLMMGRMTHEARTLAERFPECILTPSTSVDSWPELESHESILLQEASLKLAERGVADSASNPDSRLEHLVRATEEMRTSHNTLESRLVEWAGLFLPSLDLDQNRNQIAVAVAESENMQETADHLGTKSAEVEIGKKEWSGIYSLAKSTVNLAADVERMEDSVRELSNIHLPSLSLLLGPLLAAKLCTTAHGRDRLARLPASTIQVLGAETAFFMHIQQGTPSPKHGHIFQHSWICRSPKWTRGSIARMLASKAAIAARVDHFGGEAWTSKQVSEVEQKVGEIRARKTRR
jgi:nucleolar protein 56